MFYCINGGLFCLFYVYTLNLSFVSDPLISVLFVFNNFKKSLALDGWHAGFQLMTLNLNSKTNESH